MERNCWLRLQVDSCGLTDLTEEEYLLSLTDTSPHKAGTNTKITLAINHTEDFTKIKGPFNTKFFLYV